MIVENRVASYVRSLIPDVDETLFRIGEEARRQHIPIIRPETGELLKVLLLLKRPLGILEIGTAVGYSALYMSRYMPEAAHITTIESYEPRVVMARENIRRAGEEKRITLHFDDAARVLPTLHAGYDFVFMDAAKGQYMHFLEEVYRLLAPGGVLVSDNVLQDGELLESHFTVPKRNRTIHDRMREYLYTLKHHEGLETAVLTVGDGIAVSTKL